MFHLKLTRSAQFWFALVSFAALSSPATGNEDDYPNWNAYVDVSVIELITDDADGDVRKTKVWFVLLGGEPYLMTSNSRWLKNLRRDPNLKLVIEGKEYKAQAEEISGDALREKVDIASQRKYGFQESLIRLFSFRQSQILRLMPRST